MIGWLATTFDGATFLLATSVHNAAVIVVCAYWGLRARIYDCFGHIVSISDHVRLVVRVEMPGHFSQIIDRGRSMFLILPQVPELSILRCEFIGSDQLS